MKKIKKKSILFGCEDTIDELQALESIIKLTQESCLAREEDSLYYNLNQDERIILSEERNHYINLLKIALDKVNKLKQINSYIEKDIGYLE